MSTAGRRERGPSRYSQIIERVFDDNYVEAAEEVPFTRAEFAAVARDLGITLPDNLGDVLYSFRYRVGLPAAILARQPTGKEWAIFPDGRSKYRFVAVPFATVLPTRGMTITKIPDSTPGLIERYALSDEQALLAKLRHNRLLDIYSGVTTYSLQSHLRTTVTIRERPHPTRPGETQRDIAQVETDEIYVGVDKHGAHYVFPIQAKGGSDFLSVVQIWQDFMVCKHKAEFTSLLARPVAAQFMEGNAIALFSFEWDGGYGITVAPGSERHYLLVDAAELTPAELTAYAASVSP